MQLFEEYQQARQKLLDYFNAPDFYQVNAMLNVEWKYNWENYSLYWTQDGEDYTKEVLGAYDGDDYSMFLIHTCFGDKELVIFDKRKELNSAE